MIVYPAIDLRGGKVVRLKEGDPDRQTIFSDDPLRTAQSWVEQGASWIHIVNLDGAFASANDNGRILEAAAALNVKIQFGGGVREMSDIEQAISQGAARVVLGTAAVERPEFAQEAVQCWGAERICVALDARDGKIATKGWQHKTSLIPVDFGKHMAGYGLRHALFTDVNRDGLLEGVNVEATAGLARETGLEVIASGGVQALDDITRLKNCGVVAGVVIGIALYTGKFRLGEALAVAGGDDAG